MKTNTNLKSATGQITGILEVRVLRFRKRLLRAPMSRDQMLVRGPDGDEVWLGVGDTLKLNVKVDIGDAA